MKKLGTLALFTLFATNVFADGQVFYRYGWSSLSVDRGGQTFTDTQNATGAGKNDGKSGKGIGAGLDLKLMNCPLFPENSLIGEIFVDYNRFSHKNVANAINVVTDAATGLTLPKTGEVSVSELAVVIAPKYRFDGLGKFHPWIIPAGVAFMVNSPPSNTSNYLDVGYHLGAGAEYMIIKELSVGIDYRYTIGSGDPQLKVKYSSLGANLGINF
ncbi:MAG: outer membrane beta-barrel protein [Bacteriovorax sp.]|nr:outer membrane beta-barrel protein [Bacteriovorax sp.]